MQLENLESSADLMYNCLFTKSTMDGTALTLHLSR